MTLNSDICGYEVITGGGSSLKVDEQKPLLSYTSVPQPLLSHSICFPTPFPPPFLLSIPSIEQ